MGPGQNQHFPPTALDRDTGHQDHIPHLGSTNSKKNFIVSSGKMLLVSMGHLAGQRETWGGAEFHPLQNQRLL